jgi:uncharacterized membrane protein YhaH (DUF805 family)
MRNLIAIVSFIVALISGLSIMFNTNRDKQTIASIVGIVFLASFFINISEGARIVHDVTCVIMFAIAVLGAVVAIFTNEKNRRDGALITGIVSLGASLLILFIYQAFRS